MDKHHEHHHNSSDSSRIEYAKFAGVILLILLLTTVFYNLSPDSGWQEFVRWFMGVFLVTFAVFKFVGYKMFVMMFAGYDIVAKRFKPYASLYPFIELTLGALFLLDLYPTIRHWSVLIVMAIGSIGVIQEIYHRRSGIYCACLGNVIKLPLSTVSLVEDVSMALMAGLMLIV